MLTIHYGINYGSALQTCALFQYLKDRYEEVEVINYIPERYKQDQAFKVLKPSKTNVKRMLYQMLTRNKKKVSLQKFDEFYKENIVLTKVMYSIDELKRYCADFDYLIVGSDQVWNSDYNKGIDPVYYLAFASSDCKKIAYAASCGKDNYSEEEWIKIRELLSDFRKISLRESNMTNTFNSKGITASFVCDPVFLLSVDEWKIKTKEVLDIPDDYLLIYCLDSDKDALIELGNRIAKTKGLKTVLISFFSVIANKKVDYYVEGYGPAEFLSLMQNASYVVTNSFHGVAFSIRFNKQFVVAKRKYYNSRITSLLDELGLSHRYIEPDSDIADFDDICFGEVEIRLNTYVQTSEKYIQESII